MGSSYPTIPIDAFQKSTPQNYIKQHLDFYSSLSSIQLERVVRPFQLIDSSPPAAQPIRQPLPGEGGQAFISWGDTSRFSRPDITDPVTSNESLGAAGSQIKFDKDRKKNDDDTDDDTEEVVITYDEIDRETEAIKIANPSDPEQYVMVERIKRVKFARPQGGSFVFVMKNR